MPTLELNQIMVVLSHSSVQLRSVEHTGSSTAGVGRGTPKGHVGTQTDTMVPTGNRSGDEDDTDELPPIEVVPRKLSTV